MRSGRIRIFFDGGCRPNPGEMETAVVARGQSHVRRSLGVGDCSEAEWLALRHATDLALTMGADDVEFVGDSMLVVQQASGNWKCRSPVLQAHLAAWRDAVAPIMRVRVRHVARSKNLAGIALARVDI